MKRLMLTLILCLLAIPASAATITTHDGQTWAGISQQYVYCFHDQFDNFYGFQLYATSTTTNIIGWGHRHDTSYHKGDPEYTQTMDVSAYYMPETGTAKVSFDVKCVAKGCQSYVVDVVCDYNSHPWTCEGMGENRDGSRFDVSLTEIGMSGPDGRTECSVAHP